ncbi:MAG: ABC transporter [candidate division Zixibacteria bacterium RBG_16_48_11]|nr:MAG: ABC transporter [candidate division Zixibacteria bacterium RBG_16_48_11]
MSDTIIEAHNLVKKYGGLTAVDGIDFFIQKGEVFGFLGPNGAGKTTTMKMIYCFIQPTSGKLQVAGMDVIENPRQIKSILGVVPQDNNLDPDLTVYGNLMAYSRYFKLPKNLAKKRTEELLGLMQLSEKRKVIIDELSGGMRRRLVLARGLINNPKILILDEPTVGLDPQARHLIWQKVRQFRSQGITIILTTHYMDEAAYLCDRLVIMNQGKFLAEGKPEELIAKHVSEEVVELKGIQQNEAEAVSRRFKDRFHLEHFGDSLYIYAQDGKHILGELSDVKADKIIHRDADLEDVFLRLTGRGLIE